MKKLFIIAVVISAALTSAMGQTANNKSKVVNKNEAAIHKVVADFMEAWNRHDAKAFSLLFVEDADFTNVAGIGASGRTEIEKFHAPRFATTFKNSLQKAINTRIRFVKSDVAGVDVKWEMTGATDREGNITALRQGLLNFVMAKTNSKWHIVIMHNMNLPISP